MFFYNFEQNFHRVYDYHSMNFEFSDENIMLVTDCEEPGPDEGPEEGSQWSIHDFILSYYVDLKCKLSSQDVLFQTFNQEFQN